MSAVNQLWVQDSRHTWLKPLFVGVWDSERGQAYLTYIWNVLWNNTLRWLAEFSGIDQHSEKWLPVQFSILCLCCVRIDCFLFSTNWSIKVMLYTKRLSFRDETVNISFSVFYIDYLILNDSCQSLSSSAEYYGKQVDLYSAVELLLTWGHQDQDENGPRLKTVSQRRMRLWAASPER